MLHELDKELSFWLHNIKQLSKFLARNKLEIALHAFVTSRIDYCNGLFMVFQIVK